MGSTARHFGNPSQTEPGKEESPSAPRATTQARAHHGDPAGEALADWRGMESLREELLRLPASSLCEPRVRVPVVLQEGTQLLLTVNQSHVRERLLATGISSDSLDTLAQAIDALRVAHANVVGSLCPDDDFAEALASALELRDELVAACHWNLRQRDVADYLVRITDSSDITELSMDLKELAQLVELYLADFAADGTFDAPNCMRQARALADELTATLAREIPQAVQDLRDRAFTHLARLMEEVRNAGLYAYRANVQMRRPFMTDCVIVRRRSNLHSGISSLLG